MEKAMASSTVSSMVCDIWVWPTGERLTPVGVWNGYLPVDILCPRGLVVPSLIQVGFLIVLVHAHEILSRSDCDGWREP